MNKPTRDDYITILYGIFKSCENHWMFSDLDEEEIEQSYRDLNRAGKDAVITKGLIEFLEEEYETLEDIRWSVDLALAFLRESCSSAIHEPQREEEVF